MNKSVPARPLLPLLLACLLPLSACGRQPDPPAAADGDAAAAPAARTALGRTLQDAMRKASEEVANGNIRVGKDGAANLPKAEITPQGDLLVDGKPVPVDAAQRQLLLAHRANLVAIAQAGIAVGMQGADLGVKAATGALKSVFTGTTDEFEKQMEAEGAKIEAEANKICARLPPLFASQQALAEALPAFRPYATMEQSDIDDCGKDGNYNVDFAGGSDAPAGAGDAGPAMNAAAEADAAARGSSATKQ